ncbi:MAG: 8-oxoguanine deaminase, partial [Candidatus Macondimonas sp.]
FRMDDLQHAGGQSDPVASLLTCAPASAWLSIINGRVVIEDGRLLGVDLPPLIERHRRASRQLQG